MNLYEEAKVAHQKELEEAEKVKLSLSKEEYNQFLLILDEAEKRSELAQQNPAKSEIEKREEAIKPRVYKMNANNDYITRRTSRFY